MLAASGDSEEMLVLEGEVEWVGRERKEAVRMDSPRGSNC